MSATGPSAKTSLPVTLTAGTVHTEIVIDAPGGGIQIINLVDAAGAHQAPTGGASAGSAGTSVSYRRVPVDLPAAWRFVPIASLAFSPSGTTLAIASEQICLWDIAAARCTRSFGNANITAIAFSPDGKTLAATDNSGHVYLWDVATGSQTATFTDSGSDGAYSVAFSPDGKIVAAGDGNGRTFLWNVATGKPIVTPANSGSKGVNSVAFSPDGKIVAAGDGNGRTYPVECRHRQADRHPRQLWQQGGELGRVQPGWQDRGRRRWQRPHVPVECRHRQADHQPRRPW